MQEQRTGQKRDRPALLPDPHVQPADQQRSRVAAAAGCPGFLERSPPQPSAVHPLLRPRPILSRVAPPTRLGRPPPTNPPGGPGGERGPPPPPGPGPPRPPCP